MIINFIVEPDVDCDYYREVYTAQITMENGDEFTVTGNEDEVSYDGFRSDIFEDLFLSLAETNGITVTVDEEDYANFDLEEFEDMEGLDLDDGPQSN